MMAGRVCPHVLEYNLRVLGLKFGNLVSSQEFSSTVECGSDVIFITTYSLLAFFYLPQDVYVSSS